MARAYIPQSLDEFGDAAIPLHRFLHRQRHSKTQLRPCEVEPISEKRRWFVLQAHCSKKGKRHEFVVQTREGLKCLWCGVVRATAEEVRA